MQYMIKLKQKTTSEKKEAFNANLLEQAPFSILDFVIVHIDMLHNNLFPPLIV